MRGFTLLELLLVIGILAIMSYLAVPISFTFYRSQVVDGARSELLEVLSRARHNAVLQEYDSRYGVYISPSPLNGGALSTYTLYQGNSSTTRNQTYDEVYTETPNLTITATGSTALVAGDINFSKLVGTTTATGTITIQYNGATESRSVVIDSFGNAYRQ